MSIKILCLTTHFTNSWVFPEMPYEGYIQAPVLRCTQWDSASSAWHLMTQAEVNSSGLLTVVVTDMTGVSSLVPAAHPYTSKISVRAPHM
jgi:hypothetical protein